jgi:hypothetical protein
MEAYVSKVATPVRSSSFEGIFDTCASSHMTSDRNSLESFLPGRDNVVYADKAQAEYTSVSSVRLSCQISSAKITVVLLGHVQFVSGIRKSLYSWNSIKSIGKFPLIGDGVLQILCSFHGSVVINTFQSANDFNFLHVLTKSESLAVDMDDEFWDAALGDDSK